MSSGSAVFSFLVLAVQEGFPQVGTDTQEVHSPYVSTQSCSNLSSTDSGLNLQGEWARQMQIDS